MAAHEAALAYGGRLGVINLPSIRSAIERPYSGYYRRMPAKAAALVESVARNHGFTDGNKRTCLLLLGVLLDRSGYQFTQAADGPALEAMVLAVADGAMAYADICEWIAARIERKPG
jgi:death-on-curing protein